MKRQIGYITLLAILVATMGFGFTPAPGAAAAPGAGLPAHERGDASYVPGQLVVGLIPSASLGPAGAQAQGLARAVGAKVLKTGGGMALLGIDEGANLRVAEGQVARMKGVSYVEPNYIYKGDNPDAPPTVTPPTDYIIRELQGRNTSEITRVAYPVAGLQAMKSNFGGALAATYPNDPFLWWNSGWKYVGADIVSNNTTASKNVCLLDSGVDYKHPDLAANVIKGYDFVNADADPMDDFGYGTHAAGVIAAIRNNKVGIAGASTGKVVAVKVLDANNVGTTYDISLGIQYCANRTDVSILDLSMAGSFSNAVEQAVEYAVSKGKLVVAAAGDYTSTAKTYPAGFSTGYTFSSGVVAVAAGGQISGSNIYYNCAAGNTEHGAWITLVAPGTAIYSTMPYDKPFALHIFSGFNERYDYSSGTAIAAAFVSAAAARAWGYQSGLSAANIIQRLKDTGFPLVADGACWPADTAGAKEVSVSGAIDRGAASFNVRDAVTDLPIVGATVSVYYGSSSKGSSVITTTSPVDPGTNQVNMAFTNWADVINLPAQHDSWTVYTPKVSAANYTASAQKAFVGQLYWSYPNGDFDVKSGGFSNGGYAAVPPKTANFAVVALNGENFRPHLGLWLPANHKYIVSQTVYNPAYADPETQSLGSLNGFPFARYMNWDVMLDSLAIRNRPSAAAAPYYSGAYWVGVTDNNLGVTNYLDGYNVSALVWKDGVIKHRTDKGGTICGSNHWWWAMQIVSPSSGAATYTDQNNCTDLAGAPY